jgi:hypothetical protein
LQFQRAENKSMRAIHGILAMSILAIAAEARAQEDVYRQREGETRRRPELAAKPGLQLGLRAGYIGGVGNVYSGLGVMDSSRGTVPVIVDVGWRISSRFYLGAYGQVAHVFLKENPVSCPEGADCNAQQWRVGLQFDVHPVPDSRFDPYIGVGGGYEIVQTRVSANVPIPTPAGAAMGQVRADIIDRGFEFFTLTLGLDARVNRNFGVGPFIGASINQFNVHSGERTVSAGGRVLQVTQIQPQPERVHGLGFIGLRGTFNL